MGSVRQIGIYPQKQRQTGILKEKSARRVYSTGANLWCGNNDTYKEKCGETADDTTSNGEIHAGDQRIKEKKRRKAEIRYRVKVVDVIERAAELKWSWVGDIARKYPDEWSNSSIHWLPLLTKLSL